MPDRVELYKDKAGKWRWRRRTTDNNKVLAVSSEGYDKETHAREMARRCNNQPYGLDLIED